MNQHELILEFLKCTPFFIPQPLIKSIECAREKDYRFAKEIRKFIITFLANSPNATLEIIKSKPDDQEDGMFLQPARGKEHRKTLFCHIEPVSVKNSYERIGIKVKSKIQNYLDSGKTVDDWHSLISDLSRFRIICADLIGVFSVAKIVWSILKDMPSTFIRKVDDHIWTRDKELIDGTRSIHFLVRNTNSRACELQIMTLLHYAWDQANHPLYEDLRLFPRVNINEKTSESVRALKILADEDFLKWHKETVRNGHYGAVSSWLHAVDEYLIRIATDDPQAPLELTNKAKTFFAEIVVALR